MTDNKYNIEIELKAKLQEADSLIRKLRDTNTSLVSIKDTAFASGRVLDGILYNIGSRISDITLKIPSVATQAIKAFGEEEVAVQKLSAAIRANGGNVAEVVPIFKEFASEMQRATVFADDQILGMQGVATSMGVLPEQMQQVIQSAIGLSSALGMDLQSATRASAAAIQGKTELLSRYIPILSECKTDEEKFAKVQELSRSGFAQAKAEADSTLGKLKSCANAWGDLSETIGSMFAPVATDVATLLKSLCEWFSEHDSLTRLLTTSVSSLALALTFSKIGGLITVIRNFIGLSGAMKTAKTASDALNMSLRVNPAGIIITAVSALTMAYSYFKSKSEETYNANIKKSEEYRNAIQSEIDTLKQWGLTADANKKRTAEVSAEIEKLRKERDEFEKSNRKQVNTGSMGGISSYVDPSAKAELDNYNAKIAQLEKLLQALAPAEELATLAQKNHAEAIAKSDAILKKYNDEVRASKNANDALKQTRIQQLTLEKEIASLESAFANGSVSDSERIAKATRLVEAKKELVKLGDLELQQAMAISSAKQEELKTAELKKQYQLEADIAGAKIRGNTAQAESLQKQLDNVKVEQRRLELREAYIESLKSEIKSEEDLKRIRSEASRHANTVISAEQKAQAELDEKKQAQAESEKWLNAQTEASKTKQRDLDFQILKARASGNEAQAKELEGKLRIAQLTNEIFEASRKEGMSKQELINLQESASKQAQERYDLEKSITEETQRQNLAKNAQATIEDILLTREIERLKAEGKLTEATALENERSVRRAMAGFDAFFKTMDKASANKARKEVEAALRDTNKFRSQTGVSTGTHAIGGGSEQRKPATVSAKNAPLYEQWQAMGGSSSGMTFADFRKRQNAPKPLFNVGNAYNAIMSNASRIANLSGSAKVASEASSANVSKSVDDGLRQAEESKKKTSPKKKNEADNGVLKVLKKIEQNTARIVVKK